MGRRFLLDFAAALVIGVFLGTKHSWDIGLFIALAFLSIDLLYTYIKGVNEHVKLVDERMDFLENTLLKEGLEDLEEEKSE